MTKFVELSRVVIAQAEVPADYARSLVPYIRKIYSENKFKTREFNIWDHAEDSVFDQIKNAFVSTAQDLVRGHSNTVTDVSLDRSWARNYDDGDYIAPHIHGGNFIAGVVYLDVSEDSGDLLIQDPLAQYNWHSRNDKRTVGDGRVSMAITPYTGLIVVMPGYLIHSSEPKPAGKRRFILSTNFNVRREN